MTTSCPKRILIIDDDEAIRESLHAALVGRGYDVIVARDGAEGLTRAERDAPDLIILDLVMPRRSGLTVLDQITKSRAHAPHVIMLSASDFERHNEFVKTRGVDTFLPKPVDVGDLIRRVDSLLKP